MIVYTDKHRVPFVIDEADAFAVSFYHWRICKGYPVTSLGKKGAGRRSIQVHLFLLGPAPAGFEWDHRDRDKLNNRRSNLLAVTHAVNMRNASLMSKSSSGVKGVTWSKSRRGWLARITVDRRLRFIGVFDTIEAAAAARTAAEEALWGEPQAPLVRRADPLHLPGGLS